MLDDMHRLFYQYFFRKSEKLDLKWRWDINWRKKRHEFLKWLTDRSGSTSTRFTIKMHHKILKFKFIRIRWTQLLLSFAFLTKDKTEKKVMKMMSETHISTSTPLLFLSSSFTHISTFSFQKKLRSNPIFFSEKSTACVEMMKREENRKQEQKK